MHAPPSDGVMSSPSRETSRYVTVVEVEEVGATLVRTSWALANHSDRSDTDGDDEGLLDGSDRLEAS